MGVGTGVVEKDGQVLQGWVLNFLEQRYISHSRRLCEDITKLKVIRYHIAFRIK